MDLVTGLLLAVLGALFLLSGVFSGSETALFSLDPVRLRRLERSSSRRDRLVATVASHPERLLAGILFGNTLVNVASSTVAVNLARRIEMGLGVDHRVVIATLLVTGVLVVFGEAMPKGLAVQRPVKFSRTLILVLHPILRLVQPIALALERLAARILAAGGIRSLAPGGGLTRPELRLIFDDIRRQAGFSEDEGAIASNIFEFFETRAEEIMTPRVDVRGVAVDAPREELRRRVMEARHSRLPVYSESLDQVVGFLNTKEFLLDTTQPLDALLKPVHFVPETARVSVILREVQSRRLNLVVVVNEYGGTSGIITKEDLVEEVVGEIFDEQERHLEPEIRAVREGVWRVDGRIPVEDLAEVVGRPVPEGPASTLAGHVAHLLGRLARTGDVVEEAGLRYRVLSIKKHRASRIEVSRRRGRA